MHTVFATSRYRSLPGVLIVLVVCQTALLAQQDSAETSSLDEAISAAREKIKQTNKGSYAKLDTPSSKEKLALKHIAAANKSLRDGIKRFALLDEAMDLAIQAKAIPVIIAIGDARHPIGSDQIAAYRLSQLRRVVDLDLDKEQRSLVAAWLDEVTSDAVHAECYAEAEDLAELKLKLAEKFPDPIAQSYKDRAKRDIEQLRELSTFHDQYVQANQMLETDPDDKAAQRTAGIFLAFIGGDWEAGRKLLAAGDDELARLATKEGNPPRDGKSLMQMGDTWMELGEKAPAAWRSSYYGHASVCYTNAARLVSEADRKHINAQSVIIAKESAGVLGFPVQTDRSLCPKVDYPKEDIANLNTSVTSKPVSKAKPPMKTGATTKKKAGSQASRKGPTFKVIGAAYVNDNQSVDLTDRITKASQDGLLVVFVEPVLANKKFFGKLVLQVETDTGPGIEKFDHRQLAYLDSRPAPKVAPKGLVILDAWYGTGIRGEDTMVDVKTSVESRISDNRISTSVRDCILGMKDPAFGQSKVMIIRYALDGNIQMKVYEEGDMIKLGNP